MLEKDNMTAIDVIENLIGKLPGGVFCGYLEAGYPICFVNEEFLEMTGHTHEEILEDTGGKIREFFFEQDSENICRDIRSALEKYGRYEVEYRIRRKDGTYFWAYILGKRIDMPDGRSVLANVLFDVSKNRQMKKLLLEENARDDLTGVYNRRGGERLIRDKVHTEQDYIFLLMDIDNFKLVNDIYGHMEGDKVLVYIAELLRHSFRNTDIIFRLGGDEFAIFVCSCSDTQCIEKKLEKVNESFRERIRECWPMSAASLSFGGIRCRYPLEVSELYRAADRVLYSIKRTKKGSIEIQNIEIE